MDILERILEGIMDAIEYFWDGLKQPTAKYTLGAFLVSLAFLAISIIMPLTGIGFQFVSWQEATTCSVILSIIALIDSSNRSLMKKKADSVLSTSRRLGNATLTSINKVKESRYQVYEDEEEYKGDYYEDEEYEDEYSEDEEYDEGYYEDEEYEEEYEEDEMEDEEYDD